MTNRIEESENGEDPVTDTGTEAPKSRITSTVQARPSVAMEAQAADKILDILDGLPVLAAHRCFVLVQGHHQERVALAQQGQGR